MAAQTRSLVAFAHVADVGRSIPFYADLGFKVGNSVVPEGSTIPVWAWLASEKANLMVGLASGPVDSSHQAILFYLYFDDIKQTRPFASKAQHKFQSVNHDRAHTGAPVLTDSLTWFDCSVHSGVDAGDHAILIGQVRAFGTSPTAPLGFCPGP